MARQQEEVVALRQEAVTVPVVAEAGWKRPKFQTNLLEPPLWNTADPLANKLKKHNNFTVAIINWDSG